MDCPTKNLLALCAVLLSIIHASEESLLASSEASLLGSLMHSTFLFDHDHDDYARESILSHPYLSRFPRSLENNATEEDSVYNYNSLFNSTILQRKRRTIAYDTDTKTLGIDVCVEDNPKVIKYLPHLDLEFNFKIPVTQVYEDTFFNIEIPFNMNVDLFVLTDEPCADKEWKTRIEPVLSQIEELISMLGVDGRGCVMRSVCELAASPISRPDGVVGELLQVFFDYISNMDFARPDDVVNNELNESETVEEGELEDNEELKESGTDKAQNLKEEKGDNKNSKDGKKKEKQSLFKEKNKHKNKKKDEKESEKEPANNQEENAFIRDPLLNSEKPLSDKLDDLLQNLESQIKLERSKRDYLSAAIRGRSNADCREYYSTCPISLFNLASQDDY